MGKYIKLVLFLVASYGGYLYYSQNYEGVVLDQGSVLQGQVAAVVNVPKVSGDTKQTEQERVRYARQSQADARALQAHFERLGPKITRIPSGTYGYTAPSGKRFRYKVEKKNPFYCPKKKKRIYKNVSVRVID